MQYLTITDTISWSDMEQTFIPELTRRHARFVGRICVKEIGSMEELLALWEARYPGGQVTLFTKLFMDVVARPQGASLTEVMANYDARWSRLSDIQLQMLQKGVPRIVAMDSPLKKFQALLSSGQAFTVEDCAELILWALEHRNEEARPPRVSTLNEILLGHTRVAAWQEAHNLWRLTVPPNPLVFVRPFPTHKSVNAMSGVGPVLARLIGHANTRQAASLQDPVTGPAEAEAVEVDDGLSCHVVCQTCECVRCTRVLVKALQLKAWKLRCAARAQAVVEAAKLVCDQGGVGLRTLFVSKLPRKVTETDIAAALSPFGRINAIDIISDLKTGKSKGYAFVEFESISSAIDALNASWCDKGVIIPDHGCVLLDVQRSTHQPDWTPRFLALQQRPSAAGLYRPLLLPGGDVDHERDTRGERYEAATTCSPLDVLRTLYYDRHSNGDSPGIVLVQQVLSPDAQQRLIAGVCLEVGMVAGGLHNSTLYSLVYRRDDETLPAWMEDVRPLLNIFVDREDVMMLEFHALSSPNDEPLATNNNRLLFQVNLMGVGWTQWLDQGSAVSFLQHPGSVLWPRRRHMVESVVYNRYYQPRLVLNCITCPEQTLEQYLLKPVAVI